MRCSLPSDFEVAPNNIRYYSKYNIGVDYHAIDRETVTHLFFALYLLLPDDTAGTSCMSSLVRYYVLHLPYRTGQPAAVSE